MLVVVFSCEDRGGGNQRNLGASTAHNQNTCKQDSDTLAHAGTLPMLGWIHWLSHQMKSKDWKTKETRCSATVSSGKRCKIMVPAGDYLCEHHAMDLPHFVQNPNHVASLMKARFPSGITLLVIERDRTIVTVMTIQTGH